MVGALTPTLGIVLPGLVIYSSVFVTMSAQKIE